MGVPHLGIGHQGARRLAHRRARHLRLRGRHRPTRVPGDGDHPGADAARHALSDVRSKLGRELCAIRDSEHVAAASGIDVKRTKIVAFVLSAVFAGVAGGAYTLYQSFVTPDLVGLAQLMLVLSMVVVGGSGSIAGVLIGVVLIGLLPELLRAAPRGLLVWQEFVYGLILVLAVMFMPRGIWGIVQSLFTRAGASGKTAPARSSSAHARSDAMSALLSITNLTVRFGGLTRAQRLLDGRGGGLDPRADRPERRRQIHRVQLHLAVLPIPPAARSSSPGSRCWRCRRTASSGPASRALSRTSSCCTA